SPTDNAIRHRGAVAPTPPGFIGDALPCGKHALITGSVHAASDNSNKYCATYLQEASSIHFTDCRPLQSEREESPGRGPQQRRVRAGLLLMDADIVLYRGVRR